MRVGDVIYVTVRETVEFNKLFKKGEPYLATITNITGTCLKVKVHKGSEFLGIRPPTDRDPGTVLQIHPLTYYEVNLKKILE